MSDQFIPFYIPSVGEEEIAQLTDAIRSTWVTSGPKVSQFEELFAETVGASAALALHSCTAGLHLSLAVSGIGPGDEVILPDITFCSTANVVVQCGAAPVLVDVHPGSLTIDCAAVKRAITSRTRAVIAVHYGGFPAELDTLHQICRKHGILLIEDAAHAYPASYKGKPIGSRSNPTAFSFYSTKNITTGEGGMLTGTEEFMEQARILSVHGLSKAAWKRYQQGGSWQYEVHQPGFKYNMTELQAALGLAQLKKLELLQQRRKEITSRYDEAFAALRGVRLMQTAEDTESSNHLYVLRIDADSAALSRDQFIEAMTGAGIGTSVHFIPVHRLAYYRQLLSLEDAALPVSAAAGDQLVSLPLYPGLTEGQISRIIAAVTGILK